MTLTYTAYVSRKMIKYGGLGIGLFTIAYLLIAAGISAYLAAHPPYIPPDVKFGILPRTVFPDKKFTPKNFTAQLPNDTFPKFSDQAKVYLITRPNSTFLALDQDTATAKNLGFANSPVQTGYGIYAFKNDTLNQTLTMNVLDGSFTMTYPYQSDQLLLNPTKMPSKEDAINIAKGYLASAGKYPADLDGGIKKVSYWKITFDGLKSVSSLSEANIIRVDFFRTDLNSLKIISSDFNSASVSVLVTGSDMEGRKIVDVNYKYTDIDREIFATYPIKTAEQAWNDLKTGNYWPASDIETKDVTIRQMYLAYFEPITLTNYLQPIYVFQGDNNFVAYVPAVVDKYIK